MCVTGATRCWHARCAPIWLAQAKQIVHGRKMRVDTTVVEMNLHYPTDSSPLGDGSRVQTRTMKKVAQARRDGLKTKVRDRMRSVKRRGAEDSGGSTPEGRKRERAEESRVPALGFSSPEHCQPSGTGSSGDRQEPGQTEETCSGSGRNGFPCSPSDQTNGSPVFQGQTHHPGRLVSLFERG